MLAPSLDDPTELPLVGSVGFLRGTAQRALILRRNTPARPRAQVAEGGSAQAPDEPTCLVKTFTKIGGHWYDDRGSSGNRTVEERDLFATEDLALSAGRKLPAHSRRRGR